MNITRRGLLAGLASTAAVGGTLGLSLLRASPAAASLPEVTTFKSPSCSCCGAWVTRMQAEGFTVRVIELEDMALKKAELGVPDDLASCHTSIVDGFVIEGHVPANSVKRLLTERPQANGVAVPGMPMGSPGMEMGGRKEPFPVVLFTDGQSPIVWEWH